MRNWILAALSAIVIILLASAIMDFRRTHTKVASTKLDGLRQTQIDQDYRQCIHKASGSVGVASLTQMKKCSDETGYEK